MPLVLDFRLTHDRWGSTSDPSINGHSHHPNDMDMSLNETVSDKIRKYRGDYNNNPPSCVSFMTAIASTSGRLHSEFGQFHFKHTVFSSQLKSKVGNILAKDTALWITLNIDDTPVVPRSHTHPPHSETFRLLTSSMSSGVTVPHTTQCIRDM